jgi:hypothetical protein
VIQSSGELTAFATCLTSMDIHFGGNPWFNMRQ